MIWGLLQGQRLLRPFAVRNDGEHSDGGQHAASPRVAGTSNMDYKKSSSSVRTMFDRIAPRYDLLNHVLSFGQDIFWRRKLARRAGMDESTEVLDLATGTGDLLIALLRAGSPLKRAVGLDFAENMLAICRQKLQKKGLDRDVELITADASDTKLPEGSFDIVTMAFGIRNIADIDGTLREIHRLLKPGGRAMILEFSMPPASRLTGRFYAFYLRRVVPLIGGMISGDRPAYKYLDSTIERFYDPERFCRMLAGAGFSSIDAEPLTLGAVHIYSASKG